MIKGQIDRDRLRDLYLEAPTFSFKEFCKLNNFRWDHKVSSEFPTKQWQREKIQLQIEQQDDEVIADGMDSRKRILGLRVRHIDSWSMAAPAFSEVVQYKIKLLHDDVRHDKKLKEERELQIKSGSADPKDLLPLQLRFQMSAQECAMIANSVSTMIDAERRTLLVPTHAVAKDLLQIPEITETERSDSADEERINNMKWQQMNPNGLSNDDLSHIMTSWFDQMGSQATPLIEEANRIIEDATIIEPVKEEIPDNLILKEDR